MSISFSVDKSRAEDDALSLKYQSLSQLESALRLDRMRFFEKVRVNERSPEHGALSWKDAAELAPLILAYANDPKTWENFPEETRESWQRVGTQFGNLLQKSGQRCRRLLVEF